MLPGAVSSPRPPWRWRNATLLCVVACIAVTMVMQLVFFTYSMSCDSTQFVRQLVGTPVTGLIRASDAYCTMETCFDISRCPQDPKEFKLYVYPDGPPVMGHNGHHFTKIREALKNSPFRTEDPTTACLFFPNFDTTCGSGSTGVAKNWFVTRRLRSLPFWNEGKNHFVVEHNDRDSMEYVADQAIVLKTSFRDRYYRTGFDIAFPMDFYPKCGFNQSRQTKPVNERRLLAFFQGSRTTPMRAKILNLHNGEDIIATFRRSWPYCESMEDAVFSLNPRGNGLHTHRTLEILAAGSIPVNIVDHYVFPFSELVDWKTFSVHVPEHMIERIPEILEAISPEKRRQLQKKAVHVFQKYFSTKAKQLHWSMKIIRSRLYQNVSLWDTTDLAVFSKPS